MFYRVPLVSGVKGTLEGTPHRFWGSLKTRDTHMCMKQHNLKSGGRDGLRYSGQEERDRPMKGDPSRLRHLLLCRVVLGEPCDPARSYCRMRFEWETPGAQRFLRGKLPFASVDVLVSQMSSLCFRRCPRFLNKCIPSLSSKEGFELCIAFHQTEATHKAT